MALSQMGGRRTLIRAGLVVDSEGCRAGPGAVLMDGPRIGAAGAPAAIGRPSGARTVDLPDAVVLPGLVNVHCHLDLSHIGPVPFGGDFVDWIDQVRLKRAGDDQAIAASVRRGIDLARAGGTALVGDIAGAGSLIPIRELRAAGLAGVSFLEVFGVGRRQGNAIRALTEAVKFESNRDGSQDGLRLGAGPHAPYSCGIDVYRAAAELGVPVATHLAESLEELQFIRAAEGPLAGLMKSLGVWDETIYPHHAHPIDYLADALRATPFIAAHLNYVEDRHLELLADWRTTVAYCPRASAYFGHPQPGRSPHRYRQMFEAGVNVALGTDSLICLDTPDRISVLDEMRFLYRRDGTDPMTLLRMATTAGAVALGADPSLVTLAPGPTAGLLAATFDPRNPLDPFRQVLQRDDPVRWIVAPVPAGESQTGPTT
ncbi:MAG: amidohydrolase family protein [Phycisphaerales bacterium]